MFINEGCAQNFIKNSFFILWTCRLITFMVLSSVRMHVSLWVHVSIGVLLDVPAGGMILLRGILDTQVDCQSNFEYLRR